MAPKTALLMALLVGVGCGPRQEARLDARSERTTEAMQAHAQDIEALRTALLRGEEPEARAALAALKGRLPLKVLSPQANVAQRDLMRVLGEVEASPDLPTLAEGTGRLLVQCGACHRAAGIALPVEPLPPLPADADQRARMVQHGLASQRMAQALVADDEASFALAAEALAEVSLFPQALDPSGQAPPEPLEAAVRVVDLARQASGAREARGERWGQMQMACASCHRAVEGAGPEAP